MKKIVELSMAAFIFVLSPMAPAQSLGDLANKEKARRESVKSDRVITDEEVARYVSANQPTQEESEQQPGQSEAEESGKKPSADAYKKEKDSGNDEAVDFQGRTESYWRRTMSDARRSVKSLEDQSNVLVLKLNGLQDQFYKEADGYRRETIQREIQKTYYEQDLNKESLEKAKAALQDLENEARKSGALPGWIEAKTP